MQLVVDMIKHWGNVKITHNEREWLRELEERFVPRNNNHGEDTDNNIVRSVSSVIVDNNNNTASVPALGKYKIPKVHGRSTSTSSSTSRRDNSRERERPARVTTPENATIISHRFIEAVATLQITTVIVLRGTGNELHQRNAIIFVANIATRLRHPRTSLLPTAKESNKVEMTRTKRPRAHQAVVTETTKEASPKAANN